MFPLFTSTALVSGGHRVAGGFVTRWSWEVLWQNGEKSDSKWDCGKLLFSLQDKVLLVAEADLELAILLSPPAGS